MSDSDVVSARELIAPRARSGAKTSAGFKERRRAPRPKLAEIRRGANLNLLPPIVVTGAVRMIEFLLVAGIGFAVYLGYVAREGETAHLVYLAAVFTAAAANTLLLQALACRRSALLSGALHGSRSPGRSSLLSSCSGRARPAWACSRA